LVDALIEIERAAAPSTMLRMVPLPRCAGEDHSRIKLRVENPNGIEVFWRCQTFVSMLPAAFFRAAINRVVALAC
jgi:hypothetical protein